MPTQVQFRRGTTAQNNNFTGAAGEISVNSSNNTIRVHDGSTTGGFELAKVGNLSLIATSTSAQLASIISDETGSGALVFAASPELTGMPQTPTALAGTSNTMIASTAFVTTAVANLIDSAPAALDTLNELAAALGDDNNFSTTVLTQLSNKANTASLTTANVTEITNLYFTTTRARSSIDADFGGPITYNATTGNVALNVSGVTANTYGGASKVPVFTVDTFGRITSAANVSVAGVSTFTVSGNTFTIGTADGGSFSASIQPDSVTLSRDTTGDYVASMTAGNGITVGTATGEGSTPIITNTGVLSVNNQTGNATGFATTANSLSQFASTTSAQLATLISDETGSGALVFATSPTLVTPVLGVASATSINSTTIPSSKTLVVTTDKLNVLAATSSSELAGIISDETGSGALVFATSPTLVTPALGTPSSGTLTSCTGLPLTTGVTGTLPVANGGTGTASPATVAGTGIGVSGSFPNQTISNTGVTSIVAGTNISVSGATGAVTVNVSGTVAAATNATNTAITNDTTTNASFFPTFVSTTTGNLPLTVSNTKLFFNPSTGLLTSTDYNSSSDKRLKKNIKTVESALDKVIALRGVTFDWKEGGAKAIGLIAQEAEKVIPEIVSQDENGYFGIKYNNLIGVLVEAIKEQQEQINTLKKLIEKP